MGDSEGGGVGRVSPDLVEVYQKLPIDALLRSCDSTLLGVALHIVYFPKDGE